MAELFTLFSSSTGNSTCLNSGCSTLLIDAGSSCKRIVSALTAHGVDPRTLSGIVLTHEHSDHVSALKIFLKHYHIPVFGTFCTLNYLADHDLVPPDALLCPLAAGGMIGDMAFDIFPTQHDAGDACGYTFTLPHGERIGFATDLGCCTQEVLENLAGCCAVVLESNYDTRMLEASKYPYALIRRIKSDWGHLSNEACAQAAVELVKSGVRALLLAHTSKENNLEELAFHTTYGALFENGLMHACSQLEVAPKFTCSPVLSL